MALRQRTFSRNLGDAAGKIGDTLGSIAGTIRETGEQVVSISGSALDSAKGAGKQIKRLSRAAQSTGEELLHQASCLAVQTRHNLQKARLRTRLFVAEKPATTVAIVAGAAFVGGLVLGLRRRK